jgi:tRNA pseudouridine32 synthase / 23S rRNA pseudouridine746 synthase
VTAPSASGAAIDIVFVDAALIVLNKPSGLLSVPGKGADKQDCLSARVQVQYPEALPVHRLDMATSGLLVFARSPRAHKHLSQAFASRLIDKRYVAVVGGHIVPLPGQAWQLIDLPVGPDWPQRPRQKIDAEQGKSSQTRYRVLRYQSVLDATRLELAPVTGRTHQLRVHLAAIGHPICGDQLYAPPDVLVKAHRLLLHASRLSLRHPDTGEPMIWHSNSPF